MMEYTMMESIAICLLALGKMIALQLPGIIIILIGCMSLRYITGDKSIVRKLLKRFLMEG